MKIDLPIADIPRSRFKRVLGNNLFREKGWS
jgi:hypothetical protein